MKQRVGVTAFLVVVAVVALQSGDVSARSLSLTQDLKVSAIVLPKRQIIVNQTGQITEITSNTLEDVTPIAILRDGTFDTAVQLTPELYEQYRAQVPVGTAQYGVLYNQAQTVVKAGRPTLPDIKATQTQRFSFLFSNFKQS